MADMRPVAPAAATASAASTPTGPTVAATYNATAAYDYPVVRYDAVAFTPGAPAMTPV